jgi:TatD DNase family protein
MPHRGKPNQPAWVTFVAAALAEIKGLSVAEVARATSDNAQTLFGLGATIAPMETA